MALILPGSGSDGRVAGYGPGLFGPGAAGAAEPGRPIAGISFAGSVRAGHRGGGDGQDGIRMRDPGHTSSGSEAKPSQIQYFASAFQAQLYYQQTASFKLTIALATMAAETYAKILATTRPDGLAQAMSVGQSQLDSLSVNFLA